MAKERQDDRINDVVLAWSEPSNYLPGTNTIFEFSPTKNRITFVDEDGEDFESYTRERAYCDPILSTIEVDKLRDKLIYEIGRVRGFGDGKDIARNILEELDSEMKNEKSKLKGTTLRD